MSSPSPSPSLKRSLKYPAVTFYGIGAILGAGIYVLIGEVASVAAYLSPLSFLLAALIAVFSAFSYAELAARYPKSAGEAVYVEKAFGSPFMARVVGIMVVATGIVSAATMATGVVGYAKVFVSISDVLIIFLFVSFITAIASWGIKQSAFVVAVITLIEIGGLLYIAFIASEDFNVMQYVERASTYDIDGFVPVAVLMGSFLAFYAYIGFEDMVNIAEEIQQPERVLPIAIISALFIATALYMLVAFSALSVLPPQKLAQAQAPLAAVVTSKGESATWISLISLIAVINGAIVQLIMASRVIYGMAARGLVPRVFSEVNKYTLTPVYATLLSFIITLLLALAFPLGTLAQLTSIIVLGVFALVNISLIRLRKRDKADVIETVQYPVWVPIVGLLLCLSMLLMKAVFWLMA